MAGDAGRGGGYGKQAEVRSAEILGVEQRQGWSLCLSQAMETSLTAFYSHRHPRPGG